MADPFVAEIRIFPFNFAPKGWALCDGQLLPLSQNTALFALVGTFYGGDGKSTFALPNLQGSAPVHHGQGNGLTERQLGASGGQQTVTLLSSEIPAHNHALMASTDPGDLAAPAPSRSLARSQPSVYKQPPAQVDALAPQAVGAIGGSQPHNNMMPYLVLNFCIALIGIFPSRN